MPTSPNRKPPPPKSFLESSAKRKGSLRESRSRNKRTNSLRGKLPAGILPDDAQTTAIVNKNRNMTGTHNRVSSKTSNTSSVTRSSTAQPVLSKSYTTRAPTRQPKSIQRQASAVNVRASGSKFSNISLSRRRSEMARRRSPQLPLKARELGPKRKFSGKESTQVTTPERRSAIASAAQRVRASSAADQQKRILVKSKTATATGLKYAADAPLEYKRLPLMKSKTLKVKTETETQTDVKLTEAESAEKMKISEATSLTNLLDSKILDSETPMRPPPMRPVRSEDISDFDTPEKPRRAPDTTKARAPEVSKVVELKVPVEDTKARTPEKSNAQFFTAPAKEMKTPKETQNVKKVNAVNPKSPNRQLRKQWMKKVLKKAGKSETGDEKKEDEAKNGGKGESVPPGARTLRRLQMLDPMKPKTLKATPSETTTEIKLEPKVEVMATNETLRKLATLPDFDLSAGTVDLDSGYGSDSDSDQTSTCSGELSDYDGIAKEMEEEQKSLEISMSVGGEEVPATPRKTPRNNTFRRLASKFMMADSMEVDIPESPSVDEDRRHSTSRKESVRAKRQADANSESFSYPASASLLNQGKGAKTWRSEAVKRGLLMFPVRCLDKDESLFLEISVRIRNLNVRVIGNIDLYSESGDVVKTLDNGREVEVRKLEKRTINDQELFCVPTLDAGSDGYIALFNGGHQLFELTDATWDFTFFTIWECKDGEKGEVLEEYQMYHITTTEDDDNVLRFDLDSDDDGITTRRFEFQTPLEKMAMWYVLSENRNLTDEERLHRLVSRYSEGHDFEEVFQTLVMARVPPSRREEYNNLNFGDKMKKIFRYDQELEHNLKYYLDDLDHAADVLLAEDLSLLRGCIQFSSSQEVSRFVHDLGLVRIIEVINKHEGVINQEEIHHCALECFEAVMNKPPDDYHDVLGAEYILQNEDVIWFIVSNFQHSNENVRFLVVDILLGLFHITEEQYADDEEESLSGFHNLYEALLQFSLERDQKSIWWVLLAEFDKEIKHDHVENVDHCISVLHMLNQILNNPNLGLIERVESRVMLEYLGIDHAAHFIADMVEKEIGTIPGYQEKYDEFMYQYRLYQQQTEQDYAHMPGCEECFEHLLLHTEEQQVEEQFTHMLQYITMIPPETPNIWDAMLDAAERIILHKIDLKDPTEIRAEIEEELKAKDEQIEQLKDQVKIMISPMKEKIKKLQAEGQELKKQNKESKLTILQLQKEVEKLKKSLAERPVSIMPRDAAVSAPPAPKLDPMLEKYAKMLKMHIPKHAVQNKMVQDGVDKERMQEIEDFIAGKSKAAASAGAPAPKIDPQLEKYVKMLKMHIPKHAVENKMIQDGVEKGRMREIERFLAGKSDPPPLVQNKKPPKPTIDPNLKKYVKMLKMHIPKHAVKNKMVQDGVDTDRMQEIEDFIAGKIPTKAATATSEPPKPTIDPSLEKYVKMVKMHIPKHAVQNKMVQDGVDKGRMQEIEDFIAGKVPAAAAPPAEPPKPSIDPKLMKYVKMMKMHIPRHAVVNKMTQDGVDKDRIQEIEDFIAGKVPSAAQPPPAAKPELDPKLNKYLKMMKMHIPKHAVQNKMRQDGIDASRLQEIEDFIAGKPPRPKGGAALSLAPKKVGKIVTVLPDELKKYHRMLKMHIPKHVVENKMTQDGVGKKRMAEIDSFMNKTPMPVEDEGSAEKIIKELPKELKKYHKMLKMHIPQHVVMNKMTQDGVGKDRMAEIESFMTGKPMPGAAAPAPKIITELPPELKKYHKMLKMHIPSHVVQNKMVQDGVKKSRMAEIESFMTGKPMAVPGGAAPKKKKKEKPKKPPHPPDETWKDSGFFKEIVRMDSRAIIKDEEIKIFTAKPVKRQVVVKKKKPKKPKAVCLIQDTKIHQRMTFFCAGMKRDQITNKDIVQACWELEGGKLDLEALAAILPSEEVMQIIREYHDDPAKLDAPSHLYFDLQHVPRIAQRADVWFFMDKFDVQEAAFRGQITVIRHAVDMIRTNRKMKMMMAGALTLLRTTSEWKYVHGFPLQSLYTVAKKKCGDGQTWLMKMCQFVEDRNPDLLQFREELELVKEAEKYRDVGGLIQSVEKFGHGIRRCTNRLKAYKNIKPQEGFTDKFPEKVESFLEQAQPDFRLVQTLAINLAEDCKRLAKDFGLPELNEKKGPNTDYFPLIYAFATYTNQAVDMNNKIKEAKKREERKLKEKLRKEKIRQRKAAEREAAKKKETDNKKKEDLRQRKQEKKEAEKKKSEKAAKMKKTLNLASGAKEKNRTGMGTPSVTKRSSKRSNDSGSSGAFSRKKLSMEFSNRRRKLSTASHTPTTSNLAKPNVFKRSATMLGSKNSKPHKRTVSFGVSGDSIPEDGKTTPSLKRKRKEGFKGSTVTKAASGRLSSKRNVSRFRSISNADSSLARPKPATPLRRTNTFGFQARQQERELEKADSVSPVVWNPHDFSDLMSRKSLPKISPSEGGGLLPKLEEDKPITIDVQAPPT